MCLPAGCLKGERKMELYYEGLAAYLNFKSIYL